MLIDNVFPWLVERHPGHPNQDVHNPHKGSRSKGPAWLPKDQRVYQGKQEALVGKKFTKSQNGKIGEHVASKALADHFGMEIAPVNVGVNNAPVDLVANTKAAIEVKAGRVTNSQKHHTSRASIGEPGKAEKALIAKMTPQQKRAHNDRKKNAIIARKNNLVKQMSKAAGGKQIDSYTIVAVMSADGTKADAFLVPGFHLNLSWRKAASEEKNYIGTYDTDADTLFQ
jgi:hypothetical protein